MTTEQNIIDLPLQTRADVRLQSETIDAEARTVEVVWSTGATVRRMDLWTGKRYDEALSLDPRHVDLSRLNSGAPLLNAHGAFDLANVIGVVERAWIARSEGAYEGRATVRFSARDDVEPLWQDVRAGIIRNVSVGYVVRAYEVIEQDGQVPVWRAIDWQPVELSAVPVGADGGAGFRQSQVLTPCRLIGAQPTRSINRAQDAQQPESKDMDQPMTAADTDAGADGVTSRQADEAIVTRSSAEAMAVPEAAAAERHTRTRSDGATLERSDHHPQHAEAAPTPQSLPKTSPGGWSPRNGPASPASTTRRASSRSRPPSPTTWSAGASRSTRRARCSSTRRPSATGRSRPGRTSAPVVSTRKKSGAARSRRRCCTASIRIATRSANPPATGAATA